MAQETEKCPYCGESMEWGFVTGARGVYWRKGLRTFTFDPGEALGPHASMWQWMLPHVVAARCAKCKTIVIKYGREKCGRWTS